MDVLRSEVNKGEKLDYPVARKSPVSVGGLIGFVLREWPMWIISLWQSHRLTDGFLVISCEALTAEPVAVAREASERLDIGFLEDKVQLRRFASSDAGKSLDAARRPSRWIEKGLPGFPRARQAKIGRNAG